MEESWVQSKDNFHYMSCGLGLGRSRTWSSDMLYGKKNIAPHFPLLLWEARQCSVRDIFLVIYFMGKKSLLIFLYYCGKQDNAQ